MLKVKGNGLIGEAIKKKIVRDDFEFFASGVSNSKETNPFEFNREKQEFELFINERDPNKTLVYFGTYSIYDPSLINSQYKRHKIEMENLVKKLDNSLILRLPNIIGFGGNPNTMFNFFKKNILNDGEIIIQSDAYRNILDIDDLMCFINKIDKKLPQDLNIIHPKSFKVTDIVKEMFYFLNKKIKIKEIYGGEKYFPIPDKYVVDILSQCDVELNDDYLKKVIKKYV